MSYLSNITTNKQQEILDTAAVLFSTLGIRKTSVNLISSKCGISKKTFYQYFADKEAIVAEIVKKVLVKNGKNLEELLHKTLDPPSELSVFFYFIRIGILRFTPLFVSDIVKFYPNINTLILESRTAELSPFFVKNLNRGIIEGYYRKSINAKLTVDLYFRQLDSILEDSRIMSCEKSKILSHVHTFFLNGILNPAEKKGISIHKTSY